MQGNLATLKIKHGADTTLTIETALENTVGDLKKQL